MKISNGERAFKLLNVIVMILLMFLTFYPVYYVFIASISDSSLLLNREFMIVPRGFNLEAYKAVFNNPSIFSGYSVTIFVVVFGTALNVILTSIGAFLITRQDFAVRKVLTYLMIFTMYFSGGLIPTYLLVSKWLHLHDSILALILPTAISTYNLLIMKSNFEAIPKELEESASLDGANDIIILFRIIFPLSMSIVAVMILFYGVNHWNSWFQALIYIRTRSKYPLQIILREILLMNSAGSMSDTAAMNDQYMIGESIKYATIVVATLPILAVYPYIQKYFVKGIMVGAVKG